jgi:hypothetical protein
MDSLDLYSKPGNLWIMGKYLIRNLAAVRSSTVNRPDGIDCLSSKRTYIVQGQVAFSYIDMDRNFAATPTMLNWFSTLGIISRDVTESR